MQTIDNLNNTLGLDGIVSFKEGPGGLAIAEVNNDLATASIVLQGAHCLHWKPRGQQEVIWVSEQAKLTTGKSIRGGVPICWPWFGAHAQDATLPAHGFARTVMWQPVAVSQLDDGRTQLVFHLIQTDATQQMWPHESELECVFIIGSTLEIELKTKNTGTQPITIGEALHTYFMVSDVRQISIQGLDGCDYLDKVEQFKRKQQHGDIRINEETDRVYLNTANECVINDPGLNRRIRIQKRSSHSTVVWNPWIETANKMGDLGDDGYLKMLCVESANAAENVVTVNPGEEHRLWVEYQLEPLGNQ